MWMAWARKVLICSLRRTDLTLAEWPEKSHTACLLRPYESICSWYVCFELSFSKTAHKCFPLKRIDRRHLSTRKSRVQMATNSTR